MKNFLLILFLLPFISFSQKTYVPDDIFEEWLEDNNYGDGISYNDSVITSNLLNIQWMNISGRNISDLTGIEDALNVIELNANDNNLISVDLSNNLSLQYLYFSNNNISQIDLSNNLTVKYLALRNNPLISLDVSTLVDLRDLNLWNCDNLQYLDLSSNISLEYLFVYDCDTLTDLDLCNSFIVNLNGHGLDNNPNLFSIGVYDMLIADSVLTNVDPWVSFDLGCVGGGCTDPNAINYDSTALFNDLTCIYLVYGCTDTLALNYDSLATVDDGSCSYLVYGCTDTLALNYDSLATVDDGSCSYLVYGCTDTLALNYDSLATVDDGSCTYSIYGCTDTLAYNYDSLATIDDGSCLYCIYGCTNTNSLNYDSLATCDDGSCIIIIYGCTDSLALNYFPGANLDDGSCIYVGCTDPSALNYNPLATIDDGSCTYSSNCTSPNPIGLYVYDVIDTRAKVGWDNMNDSACMVWKYFVRYREVGTNSWSTKLAGVGNGLCNFGLNTVTKQLLNLTPSTTYEFKMKAFYCGGTSSNYSPPVQFTTSDVCPDMTNLTATTFNNVQSKVRFNWDTTGTYTFARILLRVDTAGASWQTAGGFGVYYPTLQVNKFGLTPGQSYRAQGRTFCDSNITAYRSPTWTFPIFWTQPGNIRLTGGTAISDLEIYPNPSDDVFNISFSSDKIQDLKIRILNVIGAQVYTEDRENFVGEYIKQISLDNYGKGIYFLEIETNNGIVNKKLIIQ